MLQLVNVIAEFQRGSQLQSQVFHDHVTPQQQQGIAVNLLEGKEKPKDSQSSQMVAKVWVCSRATLRAGQEIGELRLLVLGKLLGTIKASHSDALLFPSPPGNHLLPCTFQIPAVF